MHQEYLQGVEGRFGTLESVPSLQAQHFYEEQFEMKWLCTKLKQFSFVATVPYSSAVTLRAYSADCLAYALQEYKGLPRGVQVGVVSYNVLAAEYVEPDAIAFAMARPKIHFAAFEMPILVDLSRKSIHYYEQTPIWGAIYYKHFREYIAHHFSF